MLRQIHRWLGLVTGVIFVFVALTGIGMQTVRLISPEHDGPPTQQHGAGGPAGEGPGAPGPDGQGPDAQGPGGQMPGGPGGPDQRKPDFYHWLDHIHDGEFAGPAGRVVSLLLGVALLFFSLSGLWMYWTMFDGRSRIGKKGLFW